MTHLSISRNIICHIAFLLTITPVGQWLCLQHWQPEPCEILSHMMELFTPPSDCSLTSGNRNREEVLFAFGENRDAQWARSRRREGIVFQDSQELAVKRCENNTKAQAVREIVNRGINVTVKGALVPTPSQKKTLHTCLCGTTLLEEVFVCIFGRGLSKKDRDHLILQH